MHTLHISLLGDFRLVYGTELLTSVNTPRLQALLVYLLLHRQAPQQRQHIAFQFWPDSSEKQAHTNLRKLLFQLRNALPNPDRFLSQDHLTVQWRPDAPYTLDVAELTPLLACCRNTNGKILASGQHEELAGILNLYQGELLPGCFDEWILPIRQQLQCDVIGALEQLVNLAEHEREYRAGIRYAQRLLGLDPLYEAGYRRLMQLHALNGDRAAALQNYHACVTLLQQELGVEPDKETHAIYQRILNMDGQRTQPTTPRFDAPLVGRTTEWQTLLTTWRTAQRGQAHFVSIAGEAGMGKTRLAEELLGWASAQGFCIIRTRSYEAEGGLAYTPVAELLRSATLRNTLWKLDKVWLNEVARLLPELLTEHPQLTPPGPLTEAWQRQRFFEALARAILVEKEPLLLLMDDLQWCDSETLAWLRYLLRYAPQAKLLVLGAWRSEAVGELHPLRTLLRDLYKADQLTALELLALDAPETYALAQQTARREISVAEMHRLYAVTEGHPLFVVETVRSRDIDHTSALPLKVQAVIQARLAQLSAPARELVGVAATIGRRFSFALIREATQSQEEILVHILDELGQRRIVRELGANEYDFSHDRIREVAYQSLSQAYRRVLHRRVATALEQLQSIAPNKYYGELATHFEQAFLPDKALYYYQQAAAFAFRLHALAEVHSFCQQGLHLLKTYPDLQDNVQHELTLLVMLTVAAIGVQGYTTEQVRGLYERALALSEQVEPDERTISIYFGLWAYYFNSAAFAQADSLAEKMPEQARRLNDPFLLELAYHGRGMTMLYRGAPAAALTLYQQSLRFAQSRTRQGETFQQSQTLTLMTYSLRAITLWLQGYANQARTSMQEALKLQAEYWTPLNQAAANTIASVLHICLRDRANALAHAKVATTICDQYELSYWRLYAMVSLLWSEVNIDNPSQQAKKFAQLLEQVLQIGNYAALPNLYLQLADLQSRGGEIEASIATLHTALAIGEKTGERWWEAEHHRRLGELLIQSQAVAEAETHLQRALHISQSQGAKALELRAATSLARLWQQQGKNELARACLAPIYQWFTEGFDTLDLIEAKALLEAVRL